MIAHSDGEMLSLSIPAYYKCSVGPSTTAVVNFKFRGKFRSWRIAQTVPTRNSRVISETSAGMETQQLLFTLQRTRNASCFS